MSAKCQLMTSDTSFRNVCKMAAKNLCDINRGEMLSLVHGVLGNNTEHNSSKPNYSAKEV